MHLLTHFFYIPKKIFSLFCLVLKKELKNIETSVSEKAFKKVFLEIVIVNYNI
jgi:hypothetical protein